MAVQTDWSRRDALCDWLTANGIEPNMVPIDGDLTIVDTEHGRAIRCETFVQKDGAKVMDPRGGEAYEIRTVLLVVEPPAWWTPYEKPTREQLLTATDRVRALHVRNPHSGTCEHCSAGDYPDYAVLHPCATIRALDGEEQPS